MKGSTKLYIAIYWVFQLLVLYNYLTIPEETYVWLGQTIVHPKEEDDEAWAFLLSVYLFFPIMHGWLIVAEVGGDPKLRYAYPFIIIVEYFWKSLVWVKNTADKYLSD